ncbi:MAG: putative binding protein [Anaerocolumna sp.]|jgi:Zn-dependent peptidase ImmA (M78 family)/DNA-binding XRE family transcriptional regulator|nr:putative binding protein [Anaerocolumna sp.]
MLNNKIFNGDRLKLARLYRSKTIAELAEQTMLSKQAISQFENGKSIPSFETLLKLISILKFPREYFYQVDKDKIIIGNTYFRALLATTKKEQLSQKSKAYMLAKIYKFLVKYIEFPKQNLPEISAENHDIEQIAAKLREFWGLGNKPISNVVHLMEKNGIIVTSFITNEARIDALTQGNEIENEMHYFVVLGDDKESATRRQFSAAHELGHILLHDLSLNTEEMSKEDYKLTEKEANDFAAAFLMPKDSFIADLQYANKLEFYIELKKKWKVSISAMIIRAYQLNAISFNQYQYLMKQLSKSGWRTKEPLDDIIQMTKPTVLKKAIDILITNNVLDEITIMQELENHGLSIDRTEIEFLLGLEEGSLLRKTNNGVVISLKGNN